MTDPLKHPFAEPGGKFEGALYVREKEDEPGRYICVYPMTFGKARLCYGDDISIFNAFCYEQPVLAVAAAVLWDGEEDPLDGWHRNPLTGRRRENGDPDKEYVRP